MANSQYVEILKQDVTAWNKMHKSTRSRNKLDLSGADLRGINLEGVNLEGVNLKGVNLGGAELIGANLNYANLVAANLRGATLVSSYLIRANLTKAYITKAILLGADLSAANLYKACLIKADLSFANLSGANLKEADLCEADLCGTNLSRSNIEQANLTRVHAGETIFGDLDFSTVNGLDTVKHWAPSTVGIDTIFRSKGIIPDIFLRGAGIPENLITQIKLLTKNPLDYFTCFISYSNKDKIFAEQLNVDLQKIGIRCWFAPEDMKIGDKIRETIEKTIRGYDKVLLLLSKHSINSEWVEKEVETAFEAERERKTIILFPIRVDNAVMKCERAWAADIRRSRHIGDFTKWKDNVFYRNAFERLLRDLKPPPQCFMDTVKQPPEATASE